MQLTRAGAAANLYAECLYAVCEARKCIVGVGCTMVLEEVLTGMKPLVAHMRTFACKV